MENSLNNIYEKVKIGQRISKEDGINLFQSNDLLSIGEMANLVRERLNGNNAYYIINRHINYTNICLNRCSFCAYSREKGEKEAFTLTIDQVMEKASGCREMGVREIHIVGGLNPELPFEYYLEMLERLHTAFPDVHLQAFTAVEIHHIAQTANLSIEEVLKRLKEVGLTSIPGGGAEVFATRVRNKICPKKIDGNTWLKIMELAHNLGIKSNATMLYGHIETIEERVEHLLAPRQLQDKTNGFKSFIPLPYHPANTELGGVGTTGYEDLKTLAISRILLDNFPHIKAFWIMLGIKLAQVSLSFGVDDLDGTVVEEKIAHSAGAQTPQVLTVQQLKTLILEAGKIPVERDTLYNLE
ncbi:MAG: aminofutalosine synthase MqnE [bacterium]|nr:aminofutalosine synthase MqnE [bacterium]